MPSSTKPLVRTINHGATWTHYYIPTSKDEDFKPLDILLTFPDDKLFATHPHAYFGNTIGRIANRIADGKLLNLNGRDYQLSINSPTNAGGNNLHGGYKGWGAHDWSGPENVSRGSWDQGIKNLEGGSEKKGIAYALTSPDGDEGFPGEVKVWTYYFEGRGENGEVVLDVEYEAKLVDGQVDETVIGMTNHAYFNLNGPIQGANTREEEWKLDSHTVTLATSSYLVIDDKKPGIPSGEIDAHPLVPKEPNTAFSLTGPDGKTLDIDDCFVLPEYVKNQILITTDTRNKPLQTLVTIKGEKSGIHLRVQSTEPAFQFYTGKFVNVEPYEGGIGYGRFSGFCVEPSRFVNAPAREDWRHQVLLKKGETYGARNRYWGWKE